MGESTPDGANEADDASAEETAALRRALASRIGEMRGMDSVDDCRRRLVALRTRIETAWPQEGGGLFRRHAGLGPEAAADINNLLVALPTPLPLQPGGEPEPIILSTDTDLREVAGRAVDAALALLEGATLASPYPGSVTMFESYNPDAPAPIVVQNPPVGLLVATIIGTLDAVHETIADPGNAAREARSKIAAAHLAKVKAGRTNEPYQPLPHEPPGTQTKRGPGVPRI